MNQNLTSELLNDKVPSALFSGYAKNCVENMFRIICYYFLPPCGTTKNPHLPSSICEKECSEVQVSCQNLWDFVKSRLGSEQFIDCEDTSDLLFPIPNCCTGAGVQFTNGNTKGGVYLALAVHCICFFETDGQSFSDGVTAGAVVGILFFYGTSDCCFGNIVCDFNQKDKEEEKNR